MKYLLLLPNRVFGFISTLKAGMRGQRILQEKGKWRKGESRTHDDHIYPLNLPAPSRQNAAIHCIELLLPPIYVYVRNIERGQIIDEMDEIFYYSLQNTEFYSHDSHQFYVKMKSTHLICTKAIFQGRN